MANSGFPPPKLPFLFPFLQSLGWCANYWGNFPWRRDQRNSLRTPEWHLELLRGLPRQKQQWQQDDRSLHWKGMEAWYTGSQAACRQMLVKSCMRQGSQQLNGPRKFFSSGRGPPLLGLTGGQLISQGGVGQVKFRESFHLTTHVIYHSPPDKFLFIL